MFASLLLSIHWQHRRFLAVEAGTKNWSDALPMIRQILARAESVRENGDSTDGASNFANVLDADGHELGQVARTSPLANHILGFSGPTDVLLVLDDGGKLIVAKIISSRDTRDHVQKVQADPDFLQSLNGRTREELMDLRDVDAVSGATLTSYAILESIRFRVASMEGAGQGKAQLSSLKFPEPPRLQDVQLLYPAAAKLERDPNSDVLWHVQDSNDAQAGDLLRASPVADNNVGFQGPTDVLIAVDENREVSGLALGVSYDNEPYVGYVREDDYFRSLFNGQNLKILTALEGDTVEGVSGATMTSQAVARSLQMVAQAYVDDQSRKSSPVRQDAPESSTGGWTLNAVVTLRNLSTISMTLFGVIVGLTHLRGRRWLRVGFQCVLIGWLGLINGDMVSQALLLGWAQSGVPWQHAFGLTILTAAALLVPMATGQNVYCSHVCPHGAVQQLIRKRLPWQVRLSPKVLRWLKVFPMLLIAWVVAIGMLHLPFSPVDIEPFDAWLWSVAGLATIAVAVIGLVASLFVPMAYCRFGCPTGLMLDYVSRAGGKTWTRRDTIVLAVVVICGLGPAIF